MPLLPLHRILTSPRQFHLVHTITFLQKHTNSRQNTTNDTRATHDDQAGTAVGRVRRSSLGGARSLFAGTGSSSGSRGSGDSSGRVRRSLGLELRGLRPGITPSGLLSFLGEAVCPGGTRNQLQARRETGVGKVGYTVVLGAVVPAGERARSLAAKALVVVGGALVLVLDTSETGVCDRRGLASVSSLLIPRLAPLARFPSFRWSGNATSTRLTSPALLSG